MGSSSSKSSRRKRSPSKRSGETDKNVSAEETSLPLPDVTAHGMERPLSIDTAESIPGTRPTLEPAGLSKQNVVVMIKENPVTETTINQEGVEGENKNELKLNSSRQLSECKECSMKFGAEPDLELHITEIHLQPPLQEVEKSQPQEKFKCSKGCGREFVKGRSWRQHEVTCRGEP